MKLRRIQLLIFLTIYVGSIIKAQINTKVNLSNENKIQGWLTENNVPAVGVGLIENGEIKFIKVFGEIKKGIPAPNNTIFSVASITKPVVATLTLKLVEAGQWNIDEPLFKYWVDPDVTNDPRHKLLTTRHILSHQTGFVNWRRQHPTQKLTFDFDPGTKYQYSGEGFEYLRRALEHKFNKSLTELSDSILFIPLGMKDSRLFWDKNMDESRFAFWHDAKGNLFKPSTPKNQGINAAGSMLTTIEDFCRFSIYVINRAGLSTKLYEDMIRPQVRIKEHIVKGLGWEIVTDLPNGEYALEHSGSDNGVKTMAVVLPKSKRGIVILTNGDNGLFVYNNIIRESIDIGETLLEYISGSYKHEIITLSNNILERYMGAYLDSYGRTLTITKADSVLKVSGNGVPTATLYPEKENKFFLKDLDVQFEFIENDSLIITGNGKIDCTAKKITPPPSVKLSDEILERYVGKYSRSDNNSNLLVTKEGDVLKLSGETVPIMNLYPIAENRFFAKEFGVQFEFIIDEFNKVIKMNISGNGKLLCNAKKIN
jgi:CubicO group peptidase (beta-lactamase class C family)